MKGVGAILLLLCAYLYERRYAERKKRTASDTAALLRLLSFLRCELSAFRKPPYEILSSFQDDELSKNGFLSAIRSGVPPKDANRFLLLTEKGNTVYVRLFSALGHAYTDSALASVDHAIEELREESQRITAALPKELRVARTLLLSGGLSFLLLVL